MAPSWNTANTVPLRFDMMARWLVPEERTAIFACILPSSLSKSAAAVSSGSARTPARSLRSVKLGLGRGGIGGQFAAGLAAIGAEIGEAHLEHAAAERGVDRGRREMRVAEVEFGGGSPHLRVDIVQSAEVEGRIAPGLRGPDVAGALAPPRSSRWKSRSSLTSGLLARSTDAQPLNAPSPSAPDRPLIITIEPLSRTSALADSGACSRPGASSVSSTGMFCRSSGGTGAVALMVEFERLIAGPGAAGELDLAIGADAGFGVDALDAIFDAVAQVGKHHRAVGHRDAVDRGLVGSAGGGRRPGG